MQACVPEWSLCTLVWQVPTSGGDQLAFKCALSARETKPQGALQTVANGAQLLLSVNPYLMSDLWPHVRIAFISVAISL